ncbi:MAG: hypothetical protein IKY33_04290, partial [Clostridia bacterium]|nr:hypothetical protein [Clostridia bacterium]
MKKRVLSLCLLIAILCGMIACISIVSAAPTSQSPTLDLENDVKWLGRTHVIGDRHYFTWSNSGFEFNFNGTAAYATMHFTNNYTSSVQKHDTAYLWVYVDGEKTSVINLKEATQEVTLAKNLSKGNHTIKVVKRVNGRSNQAAVSAIWLNDGAYVTPPNVESSRKIQFLGDSITVGYASINDVVKESAWSVHSEDSTVTYAALAADYFAADNHTIAVSGRGVIWNTGGGKDTANNAPLMYNYNDWTLKQQWDHSLYQPDVVVINLGTNDNDSCKTEQDKETFRAAVKSLIQQVRGINPDAHIIWAFGAMGDSNGLRSYIESAISELNAAGDEKIYYLHLPEGKESLGHPVASAHADLAELLIAKITRVTGWTKHTTHNYAKTNHSVSDCKTPGLDKYTCDGCGDVYTEELPLSDEHKTEEELTVLTPANCEESGWGYYACLICEQQVGDLVEIPSAGARHIASATITVQTPATCTKNGVGSRLCTICNSVVVSNVKIPATGQHVAKSKWKVTKAATCLKKGVEELQCKHCNTAMESRYIPKLKGKDS